MLCVTAPQMLMPIVENLFVDFKMTITIKLKIPPTRLYQNDVNVPNKIDQRMILVIFIVNAVERFMAKSIITTVRLGRPNFIPYIPKGRGIRCSTYPKTIASDAMTPHNAMLYVRLRFIFITSFFICYSRVILT